MKTFVNSILGQTYEEEGESPDWEILFQRRKNYTKNTIPTDDIAFLTAGVDVQRDRIELEVVGWCAGKVSYSVDYRVLMGDTSTATSPVWNQLSAVLTEHWTRPDGSLMPLRLMAVDAGFNTTQVYEFCQRFDATRVIPTMGQDDLNIIVGTPRSVQVSLAGKRIGGVRYWPVGVSILKTELYAWLKMPLMEDGSTPSGYCFFPEYDAYFFKMLTAEKLQIVKDKKGFYKQAWTLPSHGRNEALDCRNYARAAATVVGIDRYTEDDWKTVATSYAKAQNNTQRPAKKGSSFLGGGSIWDR